MALHVDPPLTNDIHQIKQAWSRLLAKINTDLIDTGIDNMLFVDGTDGDDNTARRGSITYKYQTIQAALDAAVTGDVVMVGPGTYAPVVWPNTQNLTLRGAGLYATVIQGVAGAPAVSITPGATDLMGIALIEDIAVITADAGQFAIDADSSAATDAIDALHLSNVFLSADAGTNGLAATAFRFLNLKDVQAGEVDATLNEVSTVLAYDCEFNQWSDSFDHTNPYETSGRQAHAFNGCLFGVLDVSNQAWVAFGKDNQVGSITAALTDEAVVNTIGILDYQGRVVTDVTVTFAYTTVAAGPHNGLFMDHANIGGDFSCADAGTSTQRMQAAVRQAIFRDTTGSITAGDVCDLDIRGSLFDQDALAVAGDGAIDRTSWYETLAVGTDVAGTTVTFSIPYPTGKSDYSIYAECAAQPDDAGGWSFTTKTNADVVVNGTNSGGAGVAGEVRLLITRPFD